MDLKQSKLTKGEWNNTEVPISDDEKFILSTIIEGSKNVNIRKNNNKSMFDSIKIEYKVENEMFLYKKYFEKSVKDMHKYNINFEIQDMKKIKTPKKADVMRIENMDNIIQTKKSDIYEYILLDFCKNILKNVNNNTSYAFYLYTITYFRTYTIQRLNKYVLQFVDYVIEITKARLNMEDIIFNAHIYIEKNVNLLKYEDVTLYQHQKQLFTHFRSKEPKLVLYIAPTGTGKTLSPIGLSESYRIIFICVSRHVGLALAKSSISMGKKVAFAFGCETASDIRLHYFAASDYEVNKRTGGIWKVDNSIGDKVEIMICDLQSYLTAMYYMLSFNDEEDIVTYWDEPTITMDYEDHILHEKIHENWVKNKISKMVLSCATLPNEEEIENTIISFKTKFDNAELITIKSHDFKKSISLLDVDCKCIVPHLLYIDYVELQKCVKYCDKNMTLLRYFDLEEVSKFIKYVHTYNLIDTHYKINNYFEKMEDVNMMNIKLYYLSLLREINSANYLLVHNHLLNESKSKFEVNNELLRMKSMDVYRKPNNESLQKMNSVDTQNDVDKFKGVLITTRDAYTLTDGPTIYMTENVEKISKFYTKMSNIPANIFQNIMKKIMENDVLSKKICKLQEKYESLLGTDETATDKGGKKEKKNDKKEERSPELKKLQNEIDSLKSMIKSINLDTIYIPNSRDHQNLWKKDFVQNRFTSNIDEKTVLDIMALDVPDSRKMLLLMGIGTFDSMNDVKYLEIMKELAYKQKLFAIIASTDYIYGTNYSFCHGYIGKDLVNMTQQKLIQAMGRIGRNKVQQDYTVRYRDNNMIKVLLQEPTYNLEALNMNKLFCHSD